MRQSTDLNALATLDEIVRPGVGKVSGTSIAILARGVAENDVNCEASAISRAQIAPRTLHAIAADGPADVVAADAAFSVRPTSFRLHRAAHARRSVLIGDFVVAAIRATGTIVRQAYARHRQRRKARHAYDALRQLDDHTLRDLGFDRSEIASVAAEVTGAAERTRVRTLLTSHVL